MCALVKCYIPSCDSVACAFVSGLVVRASDWKADGPGSNLALAGFFSSVSYYFLLISKDGCEKGRVTPRSWT